MRVAGGILSSGFNSFSFSLLNEYIPEKRRTTANTILQSGNYIAWAMSSISVLLIRTFGWRMTFDIQAIISVLVGVVVLATVKNVGKSMQENKKANEQEAEAFEEVDPYYTRD